MRTLVDIEEYLTRLKQDQRNIPYHDRKSYPEVEAVNEALEILTRVTSPQQFIVELQSKRNLTSYEDKEYLQELKNWYNSLIDYVQEKNTEKETWETEEVIRHLISDPSECLKEIQGMSAEEIKDWVLQGNAPNELYKSFNRPPQSSFQDVDWEAVAESIAE